MNVLEQFTDAFKARVLFKTNQGSKARMNELDEVADEVTNKYGEIPYLPTIRAELENALSKKTNWGCRMVLREFDVIIAKLSAGSEVGY